MPNFGSTFKLILFLAVAVGTFLLYVLYLIFVQPIPVTLH